jgi:hypothetical protein
MSPSGRKSSLHEALPPAALAAVSSAAYGAFILAAPQKSFSTFFQTSEAMPSSAVGVASFNGLALVQNAALCLAVTGSSDKQTRKAVNAALAINHFADAAMTQYHRHTAVMDPTQANVSTALTLGVGAYAAYALWRDCAEEAKERKRADESITTLKRAL